MLSSCYVVADDATAVVIVVVRFLSLIQIDGIRTLSCLDWWNMNKIVFSIGPSQNKTYINTRNIYLHLKSILASIL